MNKLTKPESSECLSQEMAAIEEFSYEIDENEEEEEFEEVDFKLTKFGEKFKEWKKVTFQ